MMDSSGPKDTSNLPPLDTMSTLLPIFRSILTDMQGPLPLK